MLDLFPFISRNIERISWDIVTWLMYLFPMQFYFYGNVASKALAAALEIRYLRAKMNQSA